jgi:atypical dual specificity phosphatase
VGDHPAFELSGASLRTAARSVLAELTWAVRDRAVTVVLGPGGVGKSLLLRGLSGRPLPAGVARQGRWLHRGRDVQATCDSIAWVPQRTKVGPGETEGGRGGAAWRGALEGPEATVLLDEPEVGLSPGDRAELARQLGRRSERSAVVLITHDLGFARTVADDICLLVAGHIATAGPAEAFFQRPATEMARRYVQQGNCWLPGPRAPEPPAHFHWILPGRLAGMGRPGLLRDGATDLEAIASAGVEVLVSLTREPVEAEQLRSYGILGRHFPITDMGVPALAPTARLCREMERHMEAGRAVAVHCHAGMGRTGTIVAAFLVWTGMGPDEAVAVIRGANPGYIQNEAQLLFVRRFAAQV